MAATRKEKNRKTPYRSCSLTVSLVVKAKTIETEKEKIRMALRCDTSIGGGAVEEL